MVSIVSLTRRRPVEKSIAERVVHAADRARPSRTSNVRSRQLPSRHLLTLKVAAPSFAVEELDLEVGEGLRGRGSRRRRPAARRVRDRGIRGDRDDGVFVGVARLGGRVPPGVDRPFDLRDRRRLARVFLPEDLERADFHVVVRAFSPLQVDAAGIRRRDEVDRRLEADLVRRSRLERLEIVRRVGQDSGAWSPVREVLQGSSADLRRGPRPPSGAPRRETCASSTLFCTRLQDSVRPVERRGGGRRRREHEPERLEHEQDREDDARRWSRGAIAASRASSARGAA